MSSQPEKLAIEDILEQYNSHVVYFVSLAHVHAKKFPAEVLNELRSSYTHLAKAAALPDDAIEKQNELRKSRDHLRRASLDCLKIAILFTVEKTDRIIAALTSEGRLPESVGREAASLQRKRIGIFTNEAMHPSQNSTGELADLYKELDAFCRRIEEDYGGYYNQRIRNSRRLKWIRDLVIAFVLGIAASYAASEIYEYKKASSPAASATSDQKPRHD